MTPERARTRFPASGDAAATYLVGLLVALVVFSVGFYAMMDLVANIPAATGGDGADANLDAKASEGLDVVLTERLIRGPGEELERFSLAAPGGTHTLDYDLAQRLRDGKMEANPDDDVPDYPEVRAALGLDDTYDFHLRSYPILRSVEEAEWVRHKGVRVAYLGESDSEVRAEVSARPVGLHETTDSTRVLVNVENLDTAERVYKVSFTLRDGKRTLQVDDQYTGLLDAHDPDAGGDALLVEMVYHRVPSWSDNGDLAINVTVHGPYGNELWWHEYTGVTLPEGGEVDYNLRVDAGDSHYLTNEDVMLRLDHYGGDGKRLGPKDAPQVKLRIQHLDSGAGCDEEVLVQLENRVTEWTLPCSVQGDYLVELTTPDGSRAVTDRFHVSPTRLFTETAQLTTAAEYEAGLVEGLVEGFTNATHSPTSTDGDRYMDVRESVDALVSRLGGYDLLVVGSNVRHSTMTNGDTKHPIAAWVEDGGHLVVMGSEGQNTQWLQPLHGAGVANAGGGVSTPDPTHPVLHTPEALHYTTYEDHGKAWRLTSSDHYTHVIAKDPQGGQSRDALAVSDPGAFGNGTVLLSAYTPSALTTPQDRGEALKLMNNVVSTAYTMAFIDFGPPVPDGQAVASSQRLALMAHPDLPGAEVPVRVVLYVWR